jgi:hypothetical protein
MTAYSKQETWAVWLKERVSEILSARDEKAGSEADGMMKRAIELGELEAKHRSNFENYAGAVLKEGDERSNKLSTHGAPAVIPSDGEARDLILFADDILENAVIYGLSEAIADLIAGKKVLQGGRIYLYTRVKKEDEENYIFVRGLEKLIQESASGTEVIIINKWDHNGLKKEGLSSVQEVKELVESIKNEAGRKDRERGKGKENILAIIRSSKDWTRENTEYNQCGLEVPLILMNGSSHGIFRFREMIELALRTLEHEDGFEGWVREILPAVPLVEDMYMKYLDYRKQVLTRA